MMRVLLLLGLFAFVAPEPEIPNFPNYYFEIMLAVHRIKEHVISMSRNIPDLTDYRRHYAEIVHVIFEEAKPLLPCLRLPYHAYYQDVLNESAPIGISEPKRVIEEVEKLIEDVKNRIGLLLKELKVICDEHNDCKDDIDERVNLDHIPESDRLVFIATARLAIAFNHKNEEFLSVSKKYDAHKYVINGVDDIEEVVFRLADLFKALNPFQHHC